MPRVTRALFRRLYRGAEYVIRLAVREMVTPPRATDPVSLGPLALRMFRGVGTLAARPSKTEHFIVATDARMPF